RAKRLLGALPAGGATPLAAGLSLAADLAEVARRAGQAPQVILMTDGRANRALDGTTDRGRAEDDAARAAARLRAARVPVVALDSGRRVSRHLTDLAAKLGAEIVPLPRLGAALSEGIVDA
ncbi:MAG: magnesium chelatase ATPase subunit D, partial [Planctomycetota bacterium]